MRKSAGAIVASGISFSTETHPVCNQKVASTAGKTRMFVLMAETIPNPYLSYKPKSHESTSTRCLCDSGANTSMSASADEDCLSAYFPPAPDDNDTASTIATIAESVVVGRIAAAAAAAAAGTVNTVAANSALRTNI